MNDRLGLPIQRFFQGIAPGAITPPPLGSRHPMTRSYPSRSFATNPSMRREVVAVIRVPHDDPLPPRGFNARRATRCRTPFPSPCTTRAPACSAMLTDPSVLPLSAISTSPRSPACSRPGRALAMHRRQRLRLVEAGHQDR